MTNGNSTTHQSKKIVQVAVAVLRYQTDTQDKFLLATRHAHQHQGGKLEFVGGKIEPNETEQAALIREVYEELGLDIRHNIKIKMGRITHDYGDKMVRLCVYQVRLTDTQYLDFKDKNVGLDGQVIGFFDRQFVLAQKDNFPAANQAILTWLNLPSVLTISHELGFFDTVDDWLDCYQNLPKNRVLLLRTQADTADNEYLLNHLATVRQDLRFVVPLDGVSACDDASRLLAIRLTQDELMSLNLGDEQLDLPDLPIIASCHDEMSITKANELAKYRPVMAILLSPVLPTKTHPNAVHLGWERFGELAALSDVPVVALGGLRPDDMATAWRCGAMAVSGIRGFI